MILNKTLKNFKWSAELDIECDFCASKFKRDKRHTVRQLRHFCNNTCQNNYQREEKLRILEGKTTKFCGHCSRDLSLSSFSKKSSNLDGLQNFCKTCNSQRSRTYYNNNKEKHLRVIKERGEKQKSLTRNFLLDFLKNSECKDCHIKDIRVLEFDHLPQFVKNNNVSEMISGKHSIEKIKQEINKCDVVCANCHRIRTIARADKHYKKTS